MAIYTKEDIFRLVEEEDIAFIRLQFTDIFGALKNVAVTASQLEKALNNQVMFDGSSIQGLVKIEESDMFLQPDLDTFAIFPWRPQHGKVARLICNVCKTDGTPFEGDSRYVLEQAIKEAAKAGYTMKVGPECEFFLFPTDDEGRPIVESHEKAGYFDIGPTDQGENARRDMVLTLEEMGYIIESSHHENSPSQHEIDFRYSEAMEAADNIQTFKLAVKTIARQHGLHATFMPKPCKGVDGSSMHINLSLYKDGKNLFADASDPNGLSEEAYYFMGGLIKHIKGMCAILNPIVNSYKRLVPGYEAPSYIAWGFGNRSPLIRIPFAPTSENTRIELRSPDGAANPYLALALCLRAGMDGIKNKIMPPAPISGNMNKLSDAEKANQGIEALPGTLQEALAAFEKDKFIQKAVGSHISKNYLKAGKALWADYASQISPWEIDQYLHRI
ncbi:MAG: type I glutamate--ammonia ligase [Lachnospiraceae bacterium]|nr:type I glutamate--ammonia ligase [Candidatus Equihabitans merdae]